MFFIKNDRKFRENNAPFNLFFQLLFCALQNFREIIALPISYVLQKFVKTLNAFNPVSTFWLHKNFVKILNALNFLTLQKVREIVETPIQIGFFKEIINILELVATKKKKKKEKEKNPQKM